MVKPELNLNMFEEAKLIALKKRYERIVMGLDKDYSQHYSAEKSVDESIAKFLAKEITILEAKSFNEKMRFAEELKKYELEVKKERHKSCTDY